MFSFFHCIDFLCLEQQKQHIKLFIIGCSDSDNRIGVYSKKREAKKFEIRCVKAFILSLVSFHLSLIKFCFDECTLNLPALFAGIHEVMLTLAMSLM